jgi:hypothetical protein
MKLLWRWIQVILARTGLYCIPVDELHSELMGGEMTQDALAALMQVRQVDEFVRYHGLVRQLLEIADDARAAGDQQDGMRRMVEFAETNPEVVGFLKLNAWLLTKKGGLGKAMLGLNQIDNMIERDLKKSILRRRGKENVVRREL